MQNEHHYRALERMYHSANCNRYYAPKLKIGTGTTELLIPVREDFFHAAGATHGSVYFKAMDDAAFFACCSVVPDYLVLTVQFNLHLLRPITAGTLRAVGRVVYRSARLLTAEALAFDDDGREIARGSGQFLKSRIRLDSVPGYAPGAPCAVSTHREDDTGPRG